MYVANVKTGSIISVYENVILKFPNALMHDFVCPTCQIPSTIPWAHSNYTNTCTSDNILTILLLHCHEIPTFIECIGNSPAEKALKAALCTMLDGDVHNGKTIMLDHIKSVLPLKTCGKKINCFGSEYSNFVQISEVSLETSI